jgi:hypothetical protein
VKYEKCKKRKFTLKNMQDMQSSFYMEEEVGKGMGGCKIL